MRDINNDLSEFDEDITRMMNDPNFKSKQQICEAEYEKGKQLEQKFQDTGNEDYLRENTR